MRYAEEKETKNKPRSQAVTARMRWAKSAYSSFLAICKTASLSSGRSLWTGSLGPGLRFRRLWLFFFFLHHRTTRRRLILQKAQVRVTGVPFSLGLLNHNEESLIFALHSGHWPFISPTNPHSFFFAESPTPLPDQPRRALFPPIRVSGLHNFREAQSCALDQGERSNAQGAASFTCLRIRAKSVEYIPSRLKISPTGVLSVWDSKNIWNFFSGDKKTSFLFLFRYRILSWC